MSRRGLSLRETVAHLPIERREQIAGAARLLPASVRYGPVYRRTVLEIRKAWTVPSWAAEERRRRLGLLLERAAGTEYYGSAPGYERLGAADVDPFEVLGELPVLTREQVSEHTRQMLTVPESEVQLISTSGSSGSPIYFHLDRSRGAAEWAFVSSAWERAVGYRLDDWRAKVHGGELPGGADTFLQRSTGELRLRVQGLGPDRIREHWGMVRRRRIRWLHGYPSGMAYLAQLIDAELPEDTWRHEIRGLLLVSEECTPAHAEVLSRVFPHARVADFYGLSERTCFALRDEDGVFHPEPLYGVTELLDERGGAVAVGERGRIVTTGLLLHGQPFLRYDTGDSAERVGTDPWGQPTFRAIVSRRGRESVVAADGSLVPAIDFTYHAEDYQVVRRFRLVQDTPGRATLLVEPGPRATHDGLAQFRRTMDRIVEGRLELDVEVVEHLEPMPSGKERLVVQNIEGVAAAWA